MLQRPKKRIWPFPSWSSCSNIRRHPAGEISGSSPSITSSKASACQKLLPFTVVYFFAGAAALAAPPELRMALKKSDDGSSTSTSLLRLKLAL
jgi:hypothetical protein